jgi:hypothetical protein
LQTSKLGEQILAPFNPLRIDGNTRHRTHLHTLGLVKMPHAFGALVWVYFVNFWPEKNGFIGALGLTDIAIDAFIGDHQGHKKSIKGLNKNQLSQLKPLLPA